MFEDLFVSAADGGGLQKMLGIKSHKKKKEIPHYADYAKVSDPTIQKTLVLYATKVPPL